MNKVNLVKIEMYVTDFHKMDLSEEEWHNLLSEKLDSISLNTSIFFADFKSVDIDWDDDIDINFTSAPKESYEKYFL